ncbi:MAG: DASH family cryptochrome [Pseudomonadales bacterium]|jgi:deoxyribodipyrimidine photo-lyase|nr:DASH family cryptochrome [Pseudomonadales bacterium]
MNTIYWLGNDLRIDDNPALLAACKSDSLDLVYCVDPRWFETGRYKLPTLGIHRWSFLRQALQDFDRSVQSMGQRLLVAYEAPERFLPRLAERLAANRLVCSRRFSSESNQMLAEIKVVAPELLIEQYEGYTLLSEAQLPFDLGNLPETYSKFRRQVESVAINLPMNAVTTMPRQSTTGSGLVSESLACDGSDFEGGQFKGGEAAANEHLVTYLNSDLPLTYKQTRNEIDGWENSSKLSPWLNSGSLSVRRVVQRLNEFEAEKGSNESTHWLFVELLWREYFQWLGLQLGPDLFEFGGVLKRQPLTDFSPERFSMWCKGNTPYPLVNACMRELLATGYLSNRGRQIVASCLINELKLDWRYGAAWFQQQLIDYDTAVNWGNWQYIAGVGADPRGGRHFNILKQAQIYDGDGRYQSHWNGNESPLPEDSRNSNL